MSKNKLNFFVDALALIAFLIVAKTGLIIFFFLPEGIRRGGQTEFFGITKSTYINLHNWSGIILIILVLIHLMLHWQWIVCTIKSLFTKTNSSIIKEK